MDLHAYAREAAQRVGLDPDIFERQIQQESGFNPDVESSAGAVGIAQIVPAYHPNVDPRDPEAALDYAAQWMADLLRMYGGRYDLALSAYNAGPGNVAEFGGVPPFAETRRYLEVILGPDWQTGGTVRAPGSAPGAYNAELETEFQRLPWTCAIRSATWCLKSVGVDITAERLHDFFVPEIVNQEVGLRDASGSAIAQQLRERFGVAAHNKAVVTWDELTQLAGTRPLAIGGRAWGPGGHWTAVRRVTPEGHLELANPARGGYRGIDNILTRDDFLSIGPFSAVWINLPAPAAAQEPDWVRFRVANTDGDRLNVREQPTTSAPVMTSLPPDADVAAEGRAWRRVRTPDGRTGWVADEFLTQA